MASDNSGGKALWAAWLGATPTRCELQLSLAEIRQALRRWKALDLRRLNVQFKQDWPKDEKYSSFKFLPENLVKFHSTELYDAPLDWSTIFLSRSSTCRISMESYRLAELKYAFIRRTGRKTKILPRSKLFLWTVFKHGLLERSTILLQHSAITRTPLESSRLGELKYAVSAR